MGFLNAKKRPLKETEIISIFNSNIYYPQGLLKNEKGINRRGSKTESMGGGEYYLTNKSEFTNYPKTILEFKSERGLHPTQKPVALLEYLIKTYTNEGDKVLDFTMGSGSTGAACKNINRNFIGIELDKNYFDIAKKRIEDEVCLRLL
jgi:site-specific DNA-methyltransferase (adenine-specific)